MSLPTAETELADAGSAGILACAPCHAATLDVGGQVIYCRREDAELCDQLDGTNFVIAPLSA
ncbi:MAG: hypothetical protein H0T45_10925 [Pyrinomonadaceae bacterium]|nr:hypothetical protein [Pyrinomonadaceae bacterium]